MGLFPSDVDDDLQRAAQPRGTGNFDGTRRVASLPNNDNNDWGINDPDQTRHDVIYTRGRWEVDLSLPSIPIIVAEGSTMNVETKKLTFRI